MNMILDLLENVFAHQKNEKITLLFDLLEKPTDNSLFRNQLGKKWFKELKKQNINAEIVKYNATNSNNANLPEKCFLDKSTNSLCSKRIARPTSSTL